MWQEGDFIRAVIPHLKNGIQNFSTLADILLNYNESKDGTIQQVVLSGKQNLERADSAASAELSKVDRITENLTARKGYLDRRQVSETTEQENLRTEMQYLNSCIDSFSSALNDAQWSLNSARGTLADLENKMRESQEKQDIGIGLMFIPIIGTIAGAILIGVSEEELNQARWAASRAEEEVRNSQRAVNNFTYKIEIKKSRRKRKKEKIAECSQTIEQIEWELRQVYTQRSNISEAQQKIRNAVNMLGTLAGRARVAKTLTERVVCLPVIVNVLGEIIQKMLEIQGNRKYELLNDPDVKAAIFSLQDVYRNVSAVDEEHTLREIQFY
ncbi:hypothetical protein GJAV_G00156380 [Gymnothorax javanicus]|nr:hypothetical protein GJAV_G00156380 [Gymnothorax javanicus]